MLYLVSISIGVTGEYSAEQDGRMLDGFFAIARNVDIKEKKTSKHIASLVLPCTVCDVLLDSLFDLG